MRKANTYRNLSLYKRAFQFSLDILGISAKFPLHGGEAVMKGLSKSSEKACVKIAEGWCRRKRENAFQEHLDEAGLALAEAKLWLIVGNEYNYVHKNDFNRLNRNLAKLNDTLVSMKEEWAIAN